jgi:hypothetical protein
MEGYKIPKPKQDTKTRYHNKPEKRQEKRPDTRTKNLQEFEIRYPET